MITGFHHIALLISSEDCLDFYKKLGFTENYRLQRKADIVVLLEGYGMQLEVFVDSRHPERVLDLTEPLGTRYFALQVDELEATLEQLKLEHTEIGLDWQGIKYCYIQDPDGNQLELHE